MPQHFARPLLLETGQKKHEKQNKQNDVVVYDTSLLFRSRIEQKEMCIQNLLLYGIV